MTVNHPHSNGTFSGDVMFGKSITKLLRVLALTAGLLVGGATSASIQASAQSPASPDTWQAARELVSIVSAGLVSDFKTRKLPETWPTVEAAVRAQNPGIETRTVSELRAEFERLQLTYLSQILGDAPAVYARHFTAQEMREVVAFYRTPTGAKALTVMPLAMSEYFAAIAPRLVESSEKVQQAFVDILKKRGYRQ